MDLSRRHFCGLISAGAAVGFCGGCAVNPATGKQDLILVDPSQEKAIGLREHPKILEQFGGVYDDANAAGYVASIGGRLAAATELPRLGFTFTLLNSPVVNAFAVPGGYVYITRGLMALAGSEAELAGVIGHEIGHLIARHSAQRQSQALLAQLGVGVLGALTNQSAAQLAGSAAGLYLRSYSRDQEFEADMLGVRYLTRTGYDPAGMASFLENLRSNTQLEAKMQGRPPGETDAYDITATHPRTLDRVERAIAISGGGNPNLRQGIDDYLNVLDGMVYGDGPEQGYVLGQRFAHPGLRFEFTVPQGFRLRNTPTRVLATFKDAGLVFDSASKPFQGSMLRYIEDGWARGVRVNSLEPITINGLEAATAWVSGRNEGRPAHIRLVAIRFDTRQIFRFLFVTPAAGDGNLTTELQRTTYSFRRLTPQQVARLHPHRLAILNTAGPQSVSSFAEQMAFDDYREDRFRVLNGLGPDETTVSRRRVKIVRRLPETS